MGNVLLGRCRGRRRFGHVTAEGRADGARRCIQHPDGARRVRGDRGNGIEYGMMQAIAEGFEIMHASEYGLDLARVADVYQNGSVIESRLIGWLESAFEEFGQDLGGVGGAVRHTGEGAWTVDASKEIGVPARIIEGALQFRVESERDPSYAGQVLSVLRNQFGGHAL
ncbi:MAG: hypothetical protein Q8K99_05825 [Actinomycetota bacterium]|nr:hypothetical protein [Actinomycetota bacterium]